MGSLLSNDLMHCGELSTHPLRKDVSPKGTRQTLWPRCTRGSLAIRNIQALAAVAWKKLWDGLGPGMGHASKNFSASTVPVALNHLQINEYHACLPCVEGIEAALGALAAVGTIDGPEVQVLKDCLSKAKRSAQERPLVQQICQTESYLERARKRLTAHDEARQALVTDVEESEGRLERLRAAAVAAESVPLPRSSSEAQNQLQNLQQMVNQLQEERDALARELQGAPVERPKVRQRLSHAYGACMIPPMPTTIPRDLNDWMQERHGELQEAMNEGHNSKVLELTSMLSNAAEKMCDDRRQDVLIDESRSHSRYGLRGVRVGEASHPGPPRRQSSRPIAGRDVRVSIQMEPYRWMRRVMSWESLTVPFRRCTNPGGSGEGSRATAMPR